jgi:hypothetical protein
VSSSPPPVSTQAPSSSQIITVSTLISLRCKHRSLFLFALPVRSVLQPQLLVSCIVPHHNLTLVDSCLTFAVALAGSTKVRDFHHVSPVQYYGCSPPHHHRNAALDCGASFYPSSLHPILALFDSCFDCHGSPLRLRQVKRRAVFHGRAQQQSFRRLSATRPSSLCDLQLLLLLLPLYFFPFVCVLGLSRRPLLTRELEHQTFFGTTNKPRSSNIYPSRHRKWCHRHAYGCPNALVQPNCFNRSC